MFLSSKDTHKARLRLHFLHECRRHDILPDQHLTSSQLKKCTLSMQEAPTNILAICSWHGLV